MPFHAGAFILQQPLMRSELTPHSWVDYRHRWRSSVETEPLLGHLLTALPFEQHSVSLFGRSVPQPRLISWCGTEPYRYSGLTLPPRPTPKSLTKLLTAVNSEARVEFNHVLLNLYRTGQDSMGMHADNEPELGPEPTVATFTLGATRRFVLRARNSSHQAEYLLGDGSLLIMGGRCQTEYTHGIPKTRQPVGLRLSLTFRQITSR